MSRRGHRPGRRLGRGVVTPIIHFANGVFSRSGTGASYLTSPPNSTGGFIRWADENQLRQDRRDGRAGLYLFEPSRVNLCLHCEDLNNAVWTKTGATVSGTSAVAPDGDADCTTISMSAATDEVTQEISGTSATNYYTSVWVRRPSGTGAVRLSYILRDGSTAVSDDIPISSTWTRVRDRRNWLAGAVAPIVGIRNDAAGSAQDVEVWGFQVEADFAGAASSLIQTEGAAVTRAVDLLTFTNVPEVLRNGAFAVDVSPCEADTSHMIYSYSATLLDRLELRAGPTGPNAQVGGVAQYSRGTAISYAADSVVRLTFDHAGAVLAVEGASSGDGTGAAGTPVAYSDGYLSVGNRNGLGGLPIRIGEPYRL